MRAERKTGMEKIGSVLCVLHVAVGAFPLCSKVQRTRQRLWSLQEPKYSRASTSSSWFMVTSDDVINQIHDNNDGDVYTYRQLVAEDLPLNLTASAVRSLAPNTRFKYRIRQLLDYKMRHGNFNISATLCGLDKWINTQRYEYRMRMQGKDSLLTADRIDMLKKIGFDWKLESQDGLTANWMGSYRELEAFAKKHGHVKLRASDGKLGKWIANQRYQYKRWKLGESPSSMTEKRAELLEALGMVWDCRAEGKTNYDEKWQQHYQQLVTFQKENGHCFIPGNSGSLGRWMSNQRKAYHNRLRYNISALTDRREQLLRDIGFDFEVDGKTAFQIKQWKTNYEQLKDFHQQHNHTRVPAHRTPLRNWVYWQRQEYRRLQEGKPSRITQNQLEALEKLDFVWSVGQEQPQRHRENYEKLRKICSDGISKEVLLNSDLAPWIKSQRVLLIRAKQGKQTILTKEQIQLLEAINIDVVLQLKTRTSWEGRLQQLVDFQSKHRQTRVPQNYDASLSQWVRQQRLQYKKWKNGTKSTMTSQRMEKLEKIGFEWSVPFGRPKENRPQKERRNKSAKSGPTRRRGLPQNTTG